MLWVSGAGAVLLPGPGDPSWLRLGAGSAVCRVWPSGLGPTCLLPWLWAVWGLTCLPPWLCAVSAGRKMLPPPRPAWASRSVACRWAGVASRARGAPGCTAAAAAAAACWLGCQWEHCVVAGVGMIPPHSIAPPGLSWSHPHTSLAHAPRPPHPARCTATPRGATGAPPSAGARPCQRAWSTRPCSPLPTTVRGGRGHRALDPGPQR